MRINCQKAILPIVLTVIVYLMPFKAWAGLWYVDAGITSSGNGTSWGQAVKTIQEAIDLSEAGDEVWVKQGTYLLQATIQVYKDIAIYGGFAGIETDRSQRDWEIYTTIVDGRVGIGIDGVVKCFYVEANATIDGLTIRNGYSGFGDDSYGGGMYVRYNAPTVRNCIFEDNASYYGGGIYSDGSSLRIENCQFKRNFAVYEAGALMIRYATPTIINTIFTENSAMGKGDNGVGTIIWNRASDSKFINCIFYRNDQTYQFDEGGIFYNVGCSPKIINCIFNDNSNNRGSHGIYNVNSSPIITNSLIIGSSRLGAVVERGSSSSIITNCILRDTEASNNAPLIFNDSSSDALVTYSNIEGGYPGEGNIDQDPMFVDPANGNLRLLSGSPCIDAGDNNALPADILTDLSGGPRFIDDPYTIDTGNGRSPIVDMGAYEYRPDSTDNDDDSGGGGGGDGGGGGCYIGTLNF